MVMGPAVSFPNDKFLLFEDTDHVKQTGGTVGATTDGRLLQVARNSTWITPQPSLWFLAPLSDDAVEVRDWVLGAPWVGGNCLDVCMGGMPSSDPWRVW